MSHKRKNFIRRITAVAIALLMSASGIWFAESASAATVTVLLDGRRINFPDALPRNTNGRIMVPIGIIGEEMGAEIKWYEAQGIAELYLGDRFVRLTINSATMQYGYFIEINGARAEFDTDIYVLQSPAIIIENRTFVPLRAISEGLGGTAEWIAEANTALLTSPNQSNTHQPDPTPSASPSPTPEGDLFADTPWFVTIPAAHAQAKYDNDEKFVLIYYSNDTYSRILIPVIQAAAKDSGIKLYGVDSRKPDADDLKFIWNHITKSELQYPAMFRVFSKSSVGVTIQPNHQDNITNTLNLFARNLMNDPNSGIATPRPSPTPPRADIGGSLDIRFNSIDRDAADLKFQRGDRFIYVYYRSALADSDSYLDTIKRASIEAGVDIFATDASQYNYPDNERWWGNQSGWMSHPTVYFISDRFVTSREVQPQSESRLITLFKAHHFIN